MLADAEQSRWETALLIENFRQNLLLRPSKTNLVLENREMQVIKKTCLSKQVFFQNFN